MVHISKIPRQKLLPPQPKRPILPLILSHANNQILLWKPTLLAQPLGQTSIHGRLLLCVSPLLEDLDQNQLVSALVPETRVFEDELVGLVLRYDLEVPHRSCQVGMTFGVCTCWSEVLVKGRFFDVGGFVERGGGARCVDDEMDIKM